MMPLPGQLGLWGTDDHVGPQNPAQDAVAAHVGDPDVWAAPYRGAFYRAYTPDTSEDDAQRCFRARFGVNPATVTRGLGGIVLAGPIPRKDGAT